MRLKGTRLIAAVAALFVLQAPLCVLACLPSSSAIPMADMASSDSSPCHEEPAGSPAEPPSSGHDDCGCSGETFEAVLASPDKSFTGAPVVAVAPATLSLAAHSRGNRPLLQPGETDLPPPDILLLKSTLLI